MADLYFTEEHEWLSVEADTARVGITSYAAEQLGDIVFVELPEIGKQIEAGGEAAVVESVKSASELFAPITGEIVAANMELEDAPETVNEDPTGKGWFFEIKISDKSELGKLMDKAAYDAFVAGL
ncbi:MAG: glycine cleavage system protein GcvH [Robiginitomaculum sp.]|nr:glycine cleavage system protein GcvH [Robiginitomaculum sp.]